MKLTTPIPKPPDCIVVLGGGFDPVHNAHVALAELFCDLLNPTQLRIIPTGWSSQKAPFRANPQQRVAMLSMAFAALAKKTAVFIDEQEIKRAEQGMPSYTMDTLTLLRGELGASASIVLLIGLDQLLHLHQWKNWQSLFDLAHIAVAARPGFNIDTMDANVATEFTMRSGRVEQVRATPCGLTLLDASLAIPISSTQIRNGNNYSLVPPNVLNYIEQNNIY